MYAAKPRGLFVALALVAVSACAQFNPISQGDTVQQKALAAYGSVTIMVEQIAALVAPGTLPPNTQRALISVGEAGGRTAKAGLAAYEEAEAARAAFETDSAQQGRFSTAMTNLNKWVTEAGPVIDTLKSALKGAR